MSGVGDLRLGFVGGGRHALANLYPSISMAGASVTCVATQSADSAAVAARQVGALRSYASLDDMLASETLDGIFISVAPEHQADLAGLCLQHGVSVFVEKPAGLDAAAARLLHEQASRTQSHLMVGFMKRFAPAYRRMQELMAQPTFGRLMTVNAHFAFAPWDDGLRNDSFLLYGGIHMVDLLLALFGEVTEVSGMTSSRQAEIGLQFQMRFANGGIGSMTLNGTSAWAREREWLLVSGSGGWIETTDLSMLRYQLNTTPAADWRTLGAHTQELSLVNSPMSGGQRDLYLRGFAGEVEHFLGTLIDGSEPAASALENVATMTLCDRMLTCLG